MTSLYEILGVPRNAIAAAIKEAYRRLAMKHHPDRGGDRTIFQKIQEAYAVLSDPDRRAQYDKDGTIDVKPSLRQQAEHFLPQVAEAVFNACSDPDRFDLVAAMRSEMIQARLLLVPEQMALNNAERKLKKALKRIKRKNGENLIAALLQERVDNIKRQAGAKEQQFQLYGEVLDVLKDYSYDLGSDFGSLLLGRGLYGNV